MLSANSKSRGSTLESLMLGALGPIAHTAAFFSDGLTGISDSFRLASTLRKENQQLRRELETMQDSLVRLHGVEEELARLSRFSGYTRPETGGFFVADVVYVDQTSWLRTLVVYTGTAKPRHNQPVVTASGLVGRIVVPAEPYAKVLLVTDRAASVSAMIQRTRRRGIIRGGGEESLFLDNIPLQEAVRLGDQVVTAGIDGVFPRGIPIGLVSQVEPGPELFHRIWVTPHIDFALLDQVRVLTEEIVPGEIKEALSGEEGPTR
ncbi:MAG: rod shape-determining protein MreC [bacterium]|nr:rod shape-determining protein MreC [bacterium]